MPEDYPTSSNNNRNKTTTVFKSPETENLLLATLSAGPVGTGDAMGKESKENIMRAVRPDGVIVKPDVSLVPTDASILADAREEHTPLIAWTHTDHGSLRTAYVFAFTRKGDSPTVKFSPAALGLNSSVWVYDVFAKTAQKLPARQDYQGAVASTGSSYLILAPVTQSGIALLGDPDKFVSTGKQRIPALKDAPGALTATVEFAAGEPSVTLHGYAPIAPKVTAAGGKVGPVSYDAVTQHFTVAVSPAMGKNAVTVTLTAK